MLIVANVQLERGQTAVVAASDSSDRSKDKTGDQKVITLLLALTPK